MTRTQTNNNQNQMGETDNDLDEEVIESDSAITERRMQQLYLNLNNIGFRNALALRLDTRNVDFIENIERLLTDSFDAMMNYGSSVDEIRLVNEYLCNLINMVIN